MLSKRLMILFLLLLLIVAVVVVAVVVVAVVVVAAVVVAVAVVVADAPAVPILPIHGQCTICDSEAMYRDVKHPFCFCVVPLVMFIR